MTKTKVSIAWCLQVFLKRDDWHMCFLANISKFLRNPFLQNTSERRGKRVKFLKKWLQKFTGEVLEDINFRLHRIDIDKN